MDDSTPNPAYDAALAYAARGWRVIPVYSVDPSGTCRCSAGSGCASPGKHPIGKGWRERASTSQADLYAWFVEEGHTNLGVVTGRDSGIFVIDIDMDAGKTGAEDLFELEDIHGRLPDTYATQTGGGGTQFFFDYPPHCNVTNAKGGLKGRDIDVRGEGGYVVMPPSVSGKGPYSVVRSGATLALPLEWLELIDPPKAEEPAPSSLPVARHADVPEGYVEAAVAAEVRRLREAREGERNETLNRCAFSLATMIPHGVMDIGTIFGALVPVAAEIGLESSEVAKTLRSGVEAGQEHPRPWPPEDRGATFIPFETSGGESDAPTGEWPMRSWDDFGNAQRLLDHYPDRLRWVEQAERWAVWMGDRWQLDVTRAAQRLAQEMIDRLPITEAMSYSDEPRVEGDKELPSYRELFLRWVAKQRYVTRVRGCLEAARGLAGVAATITDFDADPFLLNVANGVLNLDTGELVEHAPRYMMMEMAGAAYAPVAVDPGRDTPVTHTASRVLEERTSPCPRWEAFLAKMQPDAEVRAFLRRAIGYSLTGDITEQKLFLHLGEGANGKSVFLEVMTAMFGSYAQAIPRTTLLVKKHDPIPTDVARMVGKRFLQTSETGKGQVLDEEMVKSLTGGEKQAARFMRQDFFDFTPTGKIHYVTNHFPRVSSAASLWRRLVIVKWGVTIADDDPERDLRLAQRIIADELDGVLAWAVAGLAEWRTVGLGVPEVVRGWSREYEDDADEFGEFLDEHVVADAGVRVCPVRTLYDAYTAWVFKGGRGQAMSIKAFSMAMKERGYEQARDGRTRGFTGVGVRVTDDYRL